MQEIKCPNCGAIIEESQIKSKEKFLHCAYCNQTFERKKNKETRKSTNLYIIYPTLSDEDCKRLLILDLVDREDIPDDIFESFHIKTIDKKMYPFYFYNINWSADWIADYIKRYGQGSADHRNANGKSSGNNSIVLFGGAKSDNNLIRTITNYYNGYKEEDRGLWNYNKQLLTEKREFQSWPEGWKIVEELPESEVYEKQQGYVKMLLNKEIDLKTDLDAGRVSGNWDLGSISWTYEYSSTKKPICIFIPTWEIKYTYQNKLFEAVILDQQLFLTIPQADNINHKIEKLNDIQKKEDGDGPTGLGSRKEIEWIIGVGALILGIGTLFEYELSSFELVFAIFLILVGIILITIRVVRMFSKKNTVRELGNIIFESREKRKRAALKKYASDSELVKLLNE